MFQTTLSSTWPFHVGILTPSLLKRWRTCLRAALSALEPSSTASVGSPCRLTKGGGNSWCHRATGRRCSVMCQKTWTISNKIGKKWGKSWYPYKISRYVPMCIPYLSRIFPDLLHGFPYVLLMNRKVSTEPTLKSATTAATGLLLIPWHGWKIPYHEWIWMEVFIGKSLINGPFSIAMFDYQRVCVIYIYIYICVYIHIHIYIYIQRERERDRQTDTQIHG